MAKYIQIIGFLLIIVGAVLIALSMTMGWNNNNALSFGSVGMIIGGLVAYIYASKSVLSDEIKK